MKIFERIVRYGIVAVGAMIEFFIIYVLFNYFTAHFAWIELILRLLSIITVVSIINNSRHLSSDMIWIILILLFPIPGTFIFLFLGGNLFGSRTTRSIVASTQDAKKYYQQDTEVYNEMIEETPDLKGDFHYLSQTEGFPFYRNVDFDYYKVGEEGFPVMLEEMRKAEKFIFLEYFIIDRGQLWDSMYEILKEKAAQGLDVRVMYDDMGSMYSLPIRYANMLEEQGIKCVRFNRISPFVSAVMNHRDHRKIMVIDGKVAFSGGINLADEYINLKEVFGHWKDNCICIKGQAVWSYTVLFLTNWNAIRKTDEDYTVFKVDQPTTQHDGYICAYGETPFDNENTGQSVYMNILNRANHYVYIITPYLIIDTELENALILAAKRGVDVRIMTPGVPDKKLIWNLTRSFYRNLIQGGVKIYEYTPGFVHAKVFVSDDRIATVGTINLDYRSLYLHFENGTCLVNSKKVLDVKEDYLESCKVSHQMAQDDIRHNIIQRLFLGFVKLFAAQL